MIQISIHSTARVETFATGGNPAVVKDFNPLHREGGDISPRLRGPNAANFNPLHREGGDKPTAIPLLPLLYFNPLHREGGDFQPEATIWESLSFQSTPPRGWRRPFLYGLFQFLQISIHSTARVETKAIYLCEGGGWISIHSTARVETMPAGQGVSVRIISIHSTARVETGGGSGAGAAQGISIHSTARVETGRCGTEVP